MFNSQQPSNPLNISGLKIHLYWDSSGTEFQNLMLCHLGKCSSSFKPTAFSCLGVPLNLGFWEIKSMCYYSPFPPLLTIPDFMHFYQAPRIHLFFRQHSPGVLCVPQVISDPKTCFNLLMPFCILQHPWVTYKGFICSLSLFWVENPLTLHTAGLALFYKLLVALILNGTQSMSPGSDQMGMQMETDVAPVMGCFSH